MEVSQRKSFSRRKFVSVSLFLALAILVITGILIQIFENFEEGFSIHFFTAVHVLTGLVFAVLSILHTTTNWKSLKSYLNIKGAGISSEAIWAFGITTILISIGGLLAYTFF
ncbi:MAG: DUF4405 domain-containing protein [Prevotella sp.]|jgi:cytochrome b subunit of formate dehydrogenase|nr:DUF4405 domain-containing protein [Prevotella sp.]